MALLHADGAAEWMVLCGSHNGLYCLNGGLNSDSKEYNLAGLFPRAIRKTPVLVADLLSVEPTNIRVPGMTRVERQQRAREAAEAIGKNPATCIKISGGGLPRVDDWTEIDLRM
jgi:hypothetical protein